MNTYTLISPGGYVGATFEAPDQRAAVKIASTVHNEIVVDVTDYEGHTGLVVADSYYAPMEGEDG